MADEWVEKIDKTFPVSEDGLSEDPDEEEMLDFQLNDIFKLGIMNYTTAGYDSEIEMPDSAWEAIQNGEDVDVPDDLELQEIEPPTNGEN